MGEPRLPDCHGTGVVIAGDLLGRPSPAPCGYCSDAQHDLDLYQEE